MPTIQCTRLPLDSPHSCAWRYSSGDAVGACPGGARNGTPKRNAQEPPRWDPGNDKDWATRPIQRRGGIDAYDPSAKLERNQRHGDRS